MPYIKETCVAGDTIEVCKYYTYRVNVKGEKRARKEKKSSKDEVVTNRMLPQSCDWKKYRAGQQ